jgi:hypothetical protein
MTSYTVNLTDPKQTARDSGLLSVNGGLRIYVSGDVEGVVAKDVARLSRSS